MTNENKVFDAKEFGTFLKRRRKEMHVTQAQLAQGANVSTSFLSDLENGKATCELEKAIFIANMLGVDVVLKRRG